MEEQLHPNSNQPTEIVRPASGGAVKVKGAGLFRRRWPLFLGLGLLTLLTIAIITFFSVNAALESKYAGKIEPGVSISGVYIGEMTRDEAKAAVFKQLEGYTQKPVVLGFQDKEWKPTLEQLGVTINLDASLDKAAAYGKSGDFFKDMRLFKLLSPEVHNLPLEMQMDETKLNTYLEGVSQSLRIETVEPTVALNPEGILVTTEGKEGFNVDEEGTFAAIKANLTSLVPTSDNLLKVHSVPPVITTQEVTDFKASITPVLSGPVTLSFKDKTWTFDQKTIAAQVKINRSTDKKEPRHLSYTFETAYFEKFVNDLGPKINQEPKEAEVGWVDNKVGFTKPGLNGQFLVLPRTLDTLNAAFNSTDPEKRKVALAVDVKEPALSSDHPEKLGNFELVGEGVSQFAGSAYERATNIKVGAKYLNATIIKPHSVFSFLDSIGEISQKRGYVEGYAIMADQTVPDVGGGICQVSTTTFRAAFFAGLPIVERNAHIYRVSWYEEMGEPVGFDAAVYQPGVDFKFENPTDYYMYVTSGIENGRLYVRIYGNKTPNQKVELIQQPITNVTLPPPDRTEVDPKLAPGQRKQVDSARKGLTTGITRVIKVDGQEIKRSTFGTRFKEWPNIFKVGPTPKPDPTKAPADPTKPADNTQPPGTTAPANAPTTPPAGTTAPAPKPTTPAAPTPKP